MKKPVIAMIIALLMATLACSFQNTTLEEIDPQIMFIDEPLPQAKQEAELVFKMGGGQFFITPGADGLVEGTIKYNAKQLEPNFTRRDGYFEIRPPKGIQFKTDLFKNIINTWELGITKNIPIKLIIEGGASENNFDFTGLQLIDLNIKQGASDTIILFNEPNSSVIDYFSFITGASSAKMIGLGNANFKKMDIIGGAGNYSLDFSGNLNQDTIVNVKLSVSNVTIIIPSDMNAIINNTGAVSNINNKGAWLLNDNTYSTTNEGFALTINLDMAVGNVNLIREE